MAAEQVLFQVIDTTIFILKWFWWVFVLGFIFIVKWRWKDWVMDVVIIEKRGDNLVKTNDRARKYIDPAGLVMYQLLKTKDTIPVINYNWIIHNNTVHTNILERFINLLRPTAGTIFFFRYGSKQYKPIEMKMEDGSTQSELKEILGKDGQPEYIYVYKQLDPRDKMGMLDFEVVDWDNMNFMVQEQRASVERRKNNMQKWSQIIVPLAIIALSVVALIFMWYYGYQYATDLRTSTKPQPTNTNPNPNIPVISDIVPGA